MYQLFSAYYMLYDQKITASYVRCCWDYPAMFSVWITCFCSSGPLSRSSATIEVQVSDKYMYDYWEYIMYEHRIKAESM